jgi:hypothetical protein
VSKIETLSDGQQPTQCTTQLVAASRATHEGWSFATRLDGGLYDYADAGDVERLTALGCTVYRVWVEFPEMSQSSDA